jgi:hypothetical protein
LQLDSPEAVILILDSTFKRFETVGIARVAIDDEGTGRAAMSNRKKHPEREHLSDR